MHGARGAAGAAAAVARVAPGAVLTSALARYLMTSIEALRRGVADPGAAGPRAAPDDAAPQPQYFSSDVDDDDPGESGVCARVGCPGGE